MRINDLDPGTGFVVSVLIGTVLWVIIIVAAVVLGGN